MSRRRPDSDEICRLDRRVFLRSGALALLGLGSVPGFLLRALAAADRETTTGRRRVLVCLFQRGAVDGLNMVVPHAEALYHSSRPSIGLARPRPGASEAVLDLDGFFGLHPAMKALLPAWGADQLGFLHAVGSPHPTRSHFDAQDFLETATPGRRATRDGWLNRALGQMPAGKEPSPFRGVALAPGPPRALSGPEPTLSLARLDRFEIRTPGRRRTGGGATRRAMDSLYPGSGDDPVLDVGRQGLLAVETLRSLDPDRYRPAPGADYPAGSLGASLRQVAQLIKADLGLQIAFVESTGWDHHANEGGARGILARQLEGLAGALAAFRADLGERFEDVLVVTMSEFGRTLRENGTRGTDHGHGNVMLLLGGGVRGGKVHGRWPGLEREQLFEGRDLAVTTDFRDLFAEIVHRHLGLRDPGPVFPGHRVAAKNYPGLLET